MIEYKIVLEVALLLLQLDRFHNEELNLLIFANN